MAPVFAVLLALFAGSQIYWFVQARALVKRLAKTRQARILLTAAGLALYVAFFALNFGVFGRRPSPTHLTLYEALVSAPFACWVVCSLVGFLLAILMWPLRRVARSRAVTSPGRRQFLERTATAVVAAPFVAGAYGLFYGRLNLEITASASASTTFPRASTASASRNFPIFTSAPSCPKTKSAIMCASSTT